MTPHATVDRLRTGVRKVAQAAVARGVPPSWVGYRWVGEESILDYIDRHGGPGLGGRYESVVPQTVQRNPLPRNVESLEELPTMRDWWGFSFQEVPTRKSPGTAIATLPDCSVVPAVNADEEFHPAVLNADGRALALRENWFRPWHRTALRRRAGTRKVPRVTWVMERVYTNHAHWLTGPLPKILLLRSRGQLEDVYLPEVQTPVMRASLRMLGLEPDDFPTFDLKHTIEAGELTTIDNDRLGRETVQSVRDAFRDPAAPPPTRRVFISRARASYRRLVNEDDVWALLQKAGFERVFMEDLSFEEQVELMHQTAILMGVHGAGLSNMTFCQPSAHVVEIGVRAYPSPDFYATASSLGLDYSVLFGEAVGEWVRRWPDIYLPVPRLQATLEKIGIARSG